jgi:hypothetical protein
MFRDFVQRFGIQSIVGRKGAYGKEDGGRLSDGDLTHDCLFFLGCWYLGRLLVPVEAVCWNLLHCVFFPAGFKRVGDY